MDGNIECEMGRTGESAEPLAGARIRHLPRPALSRSAYWRALLKLFADLTWRFR
ncbi:hypothetical protein IP91_00051 [Pseudoduganella lurida]|uniref:Uncharacterized protein n=1 Tax=Pseudoduganella lurida TaxID=1036180 RepID=A0A562RKM5_9BURK|nr:hypothetical protein [Pseudoduganella lurida]TWI68986.1 hypothetical protein IP91_00051 [Pseudoduganella lurida]